ncbi:MAG: EAL domain-containing protein [Alphaproteobacteria bacterium]|nr:EAL domain-containing protein [Alphaproteobacteria bacterium]
MHQSINRRHAGPGTILFNVGDPGDCAYVVERGRVEVVAGNGDGSVSSCAEGDIFGEMALIDGRTRTTRAVATEETSLFVVFREQIRDKIDHADPLLALFLKVLLSRFKDDDGCAFDATDQFLSDNAATERTTSFLGDQQRAIERLRAEHELRDALSLDQFELFYQPIIDLRNGQAAGFEALIRWRHPDRGMVPPFEFIGIAERSGLIVPMGQWVIRQACRDIQRLQQAHAERFEFAPPPFVSVNVSAKQILTDAGFVQVVADVLAAIDVDPALIKFEITESLLMEDPDLAAEILGSLKALGVSLMIDDFGTGYSSLNYLHRFPLDGLKIDRSFVMNLDDTDSREIVKAIAGLAHALSMDIVAEGIETDAQLAQMRDLDCQYGQGYLMSKPLGLTDITNWLNAGASW